jgi:hypothetical protein
MDEHVRKGHGPHAFQDAHDPKSDAPREKRGIRNRELPLPVQYLAMSALWVTWLSTVAWVWWRERYNMRIAVHFEYPALVYSLLLAAMPLVLILTGWLFLHRIRQSAELPTGYRRLRRVFELLTYLAVIVFVSGGLIACLSLPAKIRE